MSIVLLILSVVLGTVRNLLSKNISEMSFGSKSFFSSQASIFLAGSIALILLSGNFFGNVSVLTFCYALIYGMLLLLAQWCYTSALKNGKISVCSTVYSLGFIFPTISGCLLWNEQISVFDIIGILTVIPAIIISGMKKSENKQSAGNNYIIPIIIAMMSSGGLGIMQKVQQNSSYPEQRTAFVVLAFLFAGIVSFLCSLFVKSDSEKILNKKILPAAGVGIAFGCCNLLNTTLAGLLDSAVLFPVLNIGTILFSLITGIIFFKERLKNKDIVVLILGIISIILISCL